MRRSSKSTGPGCLAFVLVGLVGATFAQSPISPETDGLPLPAPPGKRSKAESPIPLGPPTAPLGGSGAAPAGPVAKPEPCGTGSGASEACKPPEASRGDCDHSRDAPITTIGDVMGLWTNARGEKVEVRPSAGEKRGELVWDGKHSWFGTFAAGKLHFERRPAPSEMGDAPDWARELAAASVPITSGPKIPLGGIDAEGRPLQPESAGQVKWELELEARMECGEPVLVGKWYPGSFQWSENVGAKGDSTESSRRITDVGRGEPIDVRYTKQPPGIVDVAVLENQTRRDSIGTAAPDGAPRVNEPGPAYLYPFQPGADDTGGALTTRTLWVYGHDLPKTRDGKIVVTSEDPKIDYLVLAVQRDWELNPLVEERVKLGRKVAQAGHLPDVSAAIQAMDGILVRATLRRGVLPGIKSFKLNGSPASWKLRFGDDIALVTFARPSYASRTAPAELKPDEVMPTQVLFKPERAFIEVTTGAPFPLDSIPLVVGVDDREVEWNGSKTIVAARVPGTTRVYRTPAIELVAPGTVPEDTRGAYFLPTDGGRIFATVENPWLFRHSAASARLLSGPGDLGHTFRYYLRRAATVDGVDPLPDLQTLDGWRQLAGHKADTLYDIAILTGYFGKDTKPKTWKQWFVDWHLKLNRPPFYYYVHLDDVVSRIDVSVAEHAALLFFRDTFVAKMDAAIAQLKPISEEFAKNKSSAAMRGLRDYLKAFGWNEDSPWRYVQVPCPGGPGLPSLGVASKANLVPSCSLPYALSDGYAMQSFGNDPEAADRWSIRATAEGLQNLTAAAVEARDQAKNLAEKDIRGMIKILGRGYEPLILEVGGRLMTPNAAGKWVPDRAALYYLRELHTLTDAVVAQRELATADAIALVKLALMPVMMMAGPVLVAEEAMAAHAVSWGLYGANAVVDVAEAYFKLPDVRFALGASLALGAEQLAAAEIEREHIYFSTLQRLAAEALTNYAGGEAIPRVLALSKSAAEIFGRPALAAIRQRGLDAFRKLQPKVQEAVLALALRCKAVQEEGRLAFAGAFEREAVAAVDKLAAEAKIPAPSAAATNPIAAAGQPLATTAAATRPRIPLPARHRLETGEAGQRYLRELMLGYRPTQKKVWVDSINEYAEKMMNDEFQWDAILEGDLIKVSKSGEIVHGHHRLIAAKIAARVTGRPLRGGPDAIIKDSAIREGVPDTPKGGSAWDTIGVKAGKKAPTKMPDRTDDPELRELRDMMGDE